MPTNFQIARNPNTPPETLTSLKNSNSEVVRRLVAWNLNTPVETLKTLARDRDSEVCWAVADHPNTDQETLDYLGRLGDCSIDYSLALHPTTSTKTLEVISKRGDSFNTTIVTRHPNAPNSIRLKKYKTLEEMKANCLKRLELTREMVKAKCSGATCSVNPKRLTELSNAMRELE